MQIKHNVMFCDSMIESINGNGPVLLKNQGDFLQFLENGGVVVVGDASTVWTREYLCWKGFLDSYIILQMISMHCVLRIL